ncbi:MAG: hypothetical protein GY946_12570, partial [bacterium]|nr:hypothetical protein [bacterium]
GLGAGGTYFMLGGNEPPPADGTETADSEDAEPIEPDVEFKERVFSLDPFVVNVTGEGYPRYLKMQVAFEMNTSEGKLEIESRVAQIRDTTILLLSSKRLSDISDFEGKALLKDDLRDRVNSLLKSGRVESVLFTEFVVQ